jgi:uncharacterized protein (DUF1778 family)
MNERPRGDSDEDIIRDLDRQIEEGIELDDAAPVRAISRNPRAVFSVRLGPEELRRISRAAASRGSSIGDFIRDAALEAAKREAESQSGDPSLVELKDALEAATRSIGRQLEAGKKAGV